MPGKAFLEITNVCNLSCSFCHGTKRTKQFMDTAHFQTAAVQIRPYATYLYFHLMGEPLLHPHLGEFLSIAGKLGFRVILTTNGTLLRNCGDVLLSAPALHKVSISLHSFEDEESTNSRVKNPYTSQQAYMTDCFRFCEQLADGGKIAVLRLWNLGVQDVSNDEILARMHSHFEEEVWQKIYSGYKIRDRIFLEWGQRFDWPDENLEPVSDSHGCFGLKDQFGVLVDGTVVPCCLDADGAIPLGNIFDTPLSEILQSNHAEAIRRGFAAKVVTEKLCRRCGYAKGKNYR